VTFKTCEVIMPKNIIGTFREAIKDANRGVDEFRAARRAECDWQEALYFALVAAKLYRARGASGGSSTRPNRAITREGSDPGIQKHLDLS
jgi:hypothetical protein